MWNLTIHGKYHMNNRTNYVDKRHPTQRNAANATSAARFGCYRPPRLNLELDTTLQSASNRGVRDDVNSRSLPNAKARVAEAA